MELQEEPQPHELLQRSVGTGSCACAASSPHEVYHAHAQFRPVTTYPYLESLKIAATAPHGRMSTDREVSGAMEQTASCVSSRVWDLPPRCLYRFAKLLDYPYGTGELCRRQFLFAFVSCFLLGRETKWTALPDFWNLRLHLLPLLVKIHPQHPP